MKVILTGASGAAGLPILRALLSDPAIDAVTVLARRPLPDWVNLPSTGSATHPKLSTISDFDFLHYTPDLQATVAAHDACIWALGKSTVGLSEEAYTELTYGFFEAFLNTLKAGSAAHKDHPYRIVFVSGGGTDSTEKSHILYARVKGRTENLLLQTAHSSDGAIKATVLRPSYFFPAPADAAFQRSRTSRYVDTVLGTALKTLLPTAAIDVEEIAKFAIGATKGTYEVNGELFENKDMKRLLREGPKDGL
ncbi:hypothetical protein FA95DRAFT_10895 [Auriscalpium vulgare]|uniref:Uncharacterized protein n=1 Tax=Auriscalpium vulgare TaxID=40419 RepID=A0ACB8SBB3_9AGAM|nr:hypothetical protein FA95DRAFT_10895 [Auriscalpium vulgare]